MCVAFGIHMHSVHGEQCTHGALTVYAPAIRLHQCTTTHHWVLVVVCMHRPRKLSSAMRPLMLHNISVRRMHIRQPSALCEWRVVIRCAFTDSVPVTRLTRLCHIPHTEVHGSNAMHGPCVGRLVSHMHSISTGPTFPVASFGGMTTMSPNDEATIAACHCSRLLHAAHLRRHQCVRPHTHIHTVAWTRAYTCT